MVLNKQQTHDWTLIGFGGNEAGIQEKMWFLNDILTKKTENYLNEILKIKALRFVNYGSEPGFIFDK